MKQVLSRDNPGFKSLRKLAQSSRQRRQRGETLLEGLHLIQAWEASGGALKQVVVSDRGLASPEIRDWLLARPNAPAVQMGDGLYDEVADTETPSGILALIDMPLLPQAPDAGLDTLILDGVQDPGNVGTLLRTAAAAGFRQILLSEDCAGAWSPKVLRSGQGAHFLLQIHEAADLAGFIRDYAGTVVATALEGASDLYASQWQSPVAWVLGSEGQGVRPAILALAHLRVRIPMPGAVESLNVGAAAAICLFETVRRRL